MNSWLGGTDMSKCRFTLKTHSTFGGLFWSPAVWRRTAGGARICETRLMDLYMYSSNTNTKVHVFDAYKFVRQAVTCVHIHVPVQT